MRQGANDFTVSFMFSNWYSGATLLAILLNNHSELTCNGETFPFKVGDSGIYICSCGKSLLNCAFYKRNASHMLDKKTGDWDTVNDRYIKETIQLFEKYKKYINPQDTYVKQAYRLFFFTLNIGYDKVPIVSETPTEITWHSYNYCSLLETCQLYDFDTREICKKIAESLVQAFIQKINKNLIFVRNYDLIRPYCSDCEESILLK